MGWISRKKKEAILMDVTKCLILSCEFIRDPRAFKMVTDNLADITNNIAGTKGMKFVDEGLAVYEKHKNQGAVDDESPQSTGTTPGEQD